MADTIPPEGRALLEIIAGTESAGSYNVIYGGQTFNSYVDHPRIAVEIKSGPNKGKFSTAAGKYQFLKGTWAEAKAALDLPDFSPASQDKAAWWLAQQEYKAAGGGNLLRDLRKGDAATLTSIGRRLSGTWTSLPNGIEQGQGSKRFVSSYNAAVRKLRAVPTPAARSAAVRASQVITDATKFRTTATGKPITASAADAIAAKPAARRAPELTTRRVTTVAIDANGTPIIRTPLAASVTPLTFPGKPSARSNIAAQRAEQQAQRPMVRKPSGVIKTAGGISGTVQLPAGVRPNVTVPGKLVVPQGPQGRRPGAARDAAATLYPHDAPRVASVPAGTVLNPGSRDSVRNAASGRVAAATLSTIARQKAEAAAAARQRAVEAHQQRLRTEAKGRADAARAQAQRAAAARAAVLAAVRMTPAGRAAATPGVSHNYPTVTRPGESYTFTGEDMAYQPRSVQTSDRWRTGY